MNLARWTSALLLTSLGGCVGIPVPAPQQPYVAVPGPGKTEAVFHTEDVACRNASAGAPYVPQSQYGQAPAPAAAPTQGAAQVPPGVIYLQCMEAHNNMIQPLAPSAPPLYGYVPAYPVYAAYGYRYDYGYPFYGVGFGFYGGGFRGGYGGYYGGYRGGFEGGYRGGYGGRFGGRGYR